MTTAIEQPGVAAPPKEETTSQADMATATLASDPKAEDVVAPMSVQHGIHLEPTKRKKTWGERLFNFGTYGGVALLGNEIASFFIMESAEKGRTQKLYEGFKGLFTRFKGRSGVPTYVSEGRLPYLIWATIGGMFMVPPVKWLEDRKGKIVRSLDRFIHGARVDSDPRFIEAHQEMDDAPVQSWGSLGKGRLVTVISAAAADYTFGWKDALTTRLSKGTQIERFSSLDAIANRTQEFAEKRFSLTKKQGGYVQLGTWLITLSTTLTLLFYASSKLFAKKRDQKIERQMHHSHDGQDADMDPVAPTEAELDRTLTEVADKPQQKVHAVKANERLQPVAAPALAPGV